MTNTEICNLALARIGITMFISSMDESSKEGRVCRMLFAFVRDRALEAYNWPFAKSETVLQDLGSPPVGWDYRYAYPDDCIKPRLITDEETLEPDPPYPFEVVENTNTKAIACNLESARLVYTKRVDTALWTPEASSALAWLLASELVLPLAADSKFLSNCLNAYQMALHDAANRTANAQRSSARPTDSYITARQ